MNISILQNRKIAELFFLVLILAAAFWARVDEFIEWRAVPDKYFFQGEPLLTTYDGYYYLSLARDLIEGTYDPVDTMRAVPDYPRRPSPPPLLSVMAANLTKVLPFSLNWIGVTLPVFLGLLLALPLYLWGRFLGGPVMALTAVMVGLLSGYYVFRSSLGWFDTDCMNATFTVSISYCFMRFGLGKHVWRYCYFCAAVIVTVLFIWWWDQARMVAALVAFVPFSMALLFFYRPPAKEAKLFYPILLLVCALILVWGGMDLPFRMSSSVWNKFLYISKQSAHDFPDIGQFISEQAKLSLSKLVEYTLTNWLAFGGSVLGVCWLCLVRFREMAFLAVPFALGICSYLFAQRFAIFIVPILALGLGWCVSLIWKHFQQNKKVHVLIGFLLLYLASTMHLKGISRGPSVFGEMVAGMAEVNRLTPKNAVVWNWGNIGYPLIYWGRRTTVSDGQVHSGERSVYNAIPFIVPDYRLSANFIRFYVKRGVKGINMFYKALGNDKDKGLKLIQQILVNGPVEAKKIILNENIGSVSWMQSTDDWLEFFYPAQSAPLYIFFDWSSNNLLHILYWFGTWDVETKNAGRLVSRVQLAYGGSVDGTVLSTLSGVSADLELGILKLGENEYELRSAAYTSDTETVEHFYPENKKGKVHLEMNIDKAFSYVAYQDEKLGTTLFNKMYWRKVHPPEKYFQLVSAEKPFYQIWKVGGDLRE